MNKVNNIISGTITNFFQYGIQILLQVLIIPIVINMAGKETFGGYTILLQIVGFITILDFGFNISINRYLAQAYSNNKIGSKFPEIVGISKTYLLFSNSLIALLILISTFFFQSIFSLSSELTTQIKYSMYILAFWTVIRTPLSIFGACLISIQKLTQFHLSSLTGNIIRLTFSILLIMIYKNVFVLILANILAEAITFLIYRYFFQKSMGRVKFKYGIHNKKLFIEMFKFGITYLGVNLAVRIFYSTDNIVVGYLFGASAVSVYYSTQMPAFLFFQFIFKISDNSSPKINELMGQNQYNEIIFLFYNIMRYSLFFTLPLGLGLILFNKPVISLWLGPTLYAGSFMTYCLALFVIFQVMSHVHAMVIVALNKMKYWSFISISVGFLNIFLSLKLGRLFGISGVMLASVIADVPLFIFLFAMATKFLNIRFLVYFQKILLKPIYISMPLLLYFLFLRNFNLNISLISVFIQIFLYILIWCFSVWFIGLQQKERDHLLIIVGLGK